MRKDELSGTKAYFTQMTMPVGILSGLQGLECFQSCTEVLGFTR